MTGVLIVDLSKYYGGADVRVFDLAKALHGRYPYAVAVLKGSILQQRLDSHHLNVLPVPFSRSDPRTARYLAQTVKRDGFTVVDAHNPQSQLWAHLLTDSVRHVSTVHSIYRQEHKNPKGRFYEQILHLNQRWNSHFIAVIEAVQHYLQQIGLPPDRIRADS